MKKLKTNQPIIKSSFIYEDVKILVEWFEVRDKTEIPDLLWQVVHVIGEIDGKISLVYNSSGREKLPGGHAEPGETLDQTLRREIKEELNMAVLEWWPIGYQKLTDPRGKVDYQFRAYAKLKKLGEFASDIGGSVIGYELVDIDEVNQRIGHGDVGERIIQIAKTIKQNISKKE